MTFLLALAISLLSSFGGSAQAPASTASASSGTVTTMSVVAPGM